MAEDLIEISAPGHAELHDAKFAEKTEFFENVSPTGIADAKVEEKEALIPENGPENKQKFGPEDKELSGEYELGTPADFPLPEENLQNFTQRARELGLSKKQAEGMLNWHKDFHNTVTGEAEKQKMDVLSNWNKEIQKDSDFGGSHWKDTLSDARRALNAFDTDGTLRELLRQTEYQHNPAVIRAIARVGRAMGEDKLVLGQGSGGSRPLEERMYPNM